MEPKHKYLDTEWKKYRDTNSDFHKKSKDKEKYSHMLIDKLNSFNIEKNKIIQEETEKRNNYIKETEEFVKSLQEKCESELPERKRIIEENISLRKEIEETIKSSMSMKDLLKVELDDREKSTGDVENAIKNNLKNKIQLISMQSQKYLMENSEMKTQNNLFKNKIDEMEMIKISFQSEWDKLNKEVEKVNNF